MRGYKNGIHTPKNLMVQVSFVPKYLKYV